MIVIVCGLCAIVVVLQRCCSHLILAIWCLLLRSGSAHCDLVLAVEVRDAGRTKEEPCGLAGKASYVIARGFMLTLLPPQKFAEGSMNTGLFG